MDRDIIILSDFERFQHPLLKQSDQFGDVDCRLAFETTDNREVGDLLGAKIKS